MTGVVLAAEGDPNQALQVLLALALLLPGSLLAAFPFALLAAARLGHHVPGILDTGSRQPLRAFLVGLMAAVAVLLLGAAAGNAKAFGIPALLALVAFLVLAFLGLVAEARGVGARLRDRSPGAGEVDGGSVAIGWLVLAGLALVPLAGALVLLYLALRAAGAAVVHLAAGEAAATA